MPQQQFEGFDPSSGGYYAATVLNGDRLPPGGIPGQVLVKTSRADFYADWMTLLAQEASTSPEGGPGISVGTTPPPAPTAGALWLNQNPNGKLQAFDGSAWRDAYDLAGVAVTPMRNLVTNPQFEQWLRTSSVVTNNGVGPDLWTIASQGSSATSFSKTAATVPGEPAITTCGRLSCLRGSEPDRYVYISQRLTGAQAKQLSGGPMTLSFWAQAAAPLSIGVDIITSGTVNSVYTESDFMPPQVAALTTTWQKFQYTFTPPSHTAQPFSIQPTLRFWSDAGSDYAARFPGLGGSSAAHHITAVQLEFGSVATAHELRPVSVEQLLCYRFYETVNSSFAVGNQLAGSQIVYNIPYKVRKATTAAVAWRTAATTTNLSSVVLSSTQVAAIVTGIVEADGDISISGSIDASVTW